MAAPALYALTTIGCFASKVRPPAASQGALPFRLSAGRVSRTPTTPRSQANGRIEIAANRTSPQQLLGPVAQGPRCVRPSSLSCSVSCPPPGNPQCQIQVPPLPSRGGWRLGSLGTAALYRPRALETLFWGHVSRTKYPQPSGLTGCVPCLASPGCFARYSGAKEG